MHDLSSNSTGRGPLNMTFNQRDGIILQLKENSEATDLRGGYLRPVKDHLLNGKSVCHDTRKTTGGDDSVNGTTSAQRNDLDPKEQKDLHDAAPMSEESEEKKIDYLAYAGLIDRSGYIRLSRLLKEKEGARAEQAHMTILSFGGDAGAAYKIARAMQLNYPKGWSLFVPGLCKSAATLIAIGAESLIIADEGELGPLDVQLFDGNELFGMASGLAIISTVAELTRVAENVFYEFLLKLRSSGVGTKISAHAASEFACGLVAPIANQIDPVKYGEHVRALQVTVAYGGRLNEKYNNARVGSIERLTEYYHAHDFVIDREEAKGLFERVSEPGEIECGIKSELSSAEIDLELGRAKGLFVDWVGPSKPKQEK